MAITHEDVAMLQGAIQNAGQGALQRRQMNQQHAAEMERLALESQMRDVMQARAEAQGQHFQTMEEQNQHNADTRQQAEQDRTDKLQSAADINSKQEMFKSIAALNATGQLTDEGRKKFNDFLAKDEHFGPAGIQLQVPDPKLQKSANKPSALASTIQTAQNYRQQAEDTDDPNEKAQFTHYADMLEKAVDKQSKFASEVPKSGSTTANEYDAAGHKVKSTTSPLVPPAPVTPAAPSPAGSQTFDFNPSSMAPQTDQMANPGLPPQVQSILNPGKPIPSGGGMPIITSAQPQVGQKVRVRHPNGQTGLIPAEQLPQAIQQGFTPIDDGNSQ